MANRTPYVILGVLMLLIIAGAGYFWLEKDITIEYDGNAHEISTFCLTVEDVLKEQNLELNSEDVIIPESDSPLADGMKIQIIRAFPVKVIFDGQEKTIMTQPDTVENLLTKAGVTLKEKDRVEPQKDQYISAAKDIKVTRVEEKTIVEVNEIPYETVTRKDYDLVLGERKVIQKGEKGEEKVTTTMVLENGEVVSKEEKKEVIKAPKPEIVLMGALMVASRDGKDFTYTEKKRMLASAYTHTGNRTATNTQPEKGVVAVDPKVIPLGTRLYIDGYGFARAEDIGSAIKGDKIDLFMETEAEALRFGRRWVTVYVLK